MEPQKPNAYLVKLTATREGWPGDMSAEEFSVIREHIDYLKDLQVRDKLILSGPVLEPFYSIIILKTESREEAEALINSDPTVAAGLQNYTVEPMRVDIPLMF